MGIAYIGLGGNLGDPPAQLHAALVAIAALEQTHIEQVSSFYRSAPMGPADQPDYCNAVCRVQTGLSPRELLAALIGIERKAGRERGPERWGPRLLDLDLLHVEGVALDEPGLHLPHPGLMRRNFVLVPLAELAPDLVVPPFGAIGPAARAIGREGLEVWQDAGFDPGA